MRKITKILFLMIVTSYFLLLCTPAPNHGLTVVKVFAQSQEKLDLLLSSATDEGNLVKVKKLIQRGANVNGKVEIGEFVFISLHCAALKGHLEVANF